jgi:glycosyltransferase involved in cell wall biosynthesis
VPLISINLPCFNSEKYLKETIQSVLDQTFTDFEIIIVNDGSTDGTGNIVKEFTDSRIRYYNQNNIGLGKTRNVQLDLSTGKYIAFIDHDDLWSPHKLEKQIKLFNDSPDLGLVYSDCAIIDGNGNIVGKWTKQNKLYRGMIFEKLLVSGFIPLSTVMIKNSIVKEIGEFKPLHNAEEYDLFLRCAYKYPFDYIGETLAQYRIHETNYGRNNPDVALNEILEIYQYWNTRLKGSATHVKKIINKGLAKSYYYYGRAQFYLKKDASGARKYFSKAIMLHFSMKTILFIIVSYLSVDDVLWIEKKVKKLLKRH